MDNHIIYPFYHPYGGVSLVKIRLLSISTASSVHSLPNSSTPSPFLYSTLISSFYRSLWIIYPEKLIWEMFKKERCYVVFGGLFTRKRGLLVRVDGYGVVWLAKEQRKIEKGLFMMVYLGDVWWSVRWKNKVCWLEWMVVEFWLARVQIKWKGGCLAEMSGGLDGKREGGCWWFAGQNIFSHVIENSGELKYVMMMYLCLCI